MPPCSSGWSRPSWRTPSGMPVTRSASRRRARDRGCCWRSATTAREYRTSTASTSSSRAGGAGRPTGTTVQGSASHWSAAWPTPPAGKSPSSRAPSAPDSSSTSLPVSGSVLRVARLLGLLGEDGGVAGVDGHLGDRAVGAVDLDAVDHPAVLGAEVRPRHRPGDGGDGSVLSLLLRHGGHPLEGRLLLSVTGRRLLAVGLLGLCRRSH